MLLMTLLWQCCCLSWGFVALCYFFTADFTWCCSWCYSWCYCCCCYCLYICCTHTQDGCGEVGWGWLSVHWERNPWYCQSQLEEGVSLSSLCPQGMQAYHLCHCSSCNSVWADLAFNVACLFSNNFSDYFPFFPCIHHSYCHVICQDSCTCYQLVVMAHNVMLSVPSLAAGCQGVLQGETPQLEYVHWPGEGSGEGPPEAPHWLHQFNMESRA